MITDSSAGQSKASRRGPGPVRHVEVRELWIQDRVAKGERSIVKVKGESNIADISTKQVDRNSLDQCVKATGVWRSGRCVLSLEMPRSR